jgi:hypothetical protein
MSGRAGIRLVWRNLRKKSGDIHPNYWHFGPTPISDERPVNWPIIDKNVYRIYPEIID